MISLVKGRIGPSRVKRASCLLEFAMTHSLRALRSRRSSSIRLRGLFCRKHRGLRRPFFRFIRFFRSPTLYGPARGFFDLFTCQPKRPDLIKRGADAFGGLVAPEQVVDLRPRQSTGGTTKRREDRVDHVVTD